MNSSVRFSWRLANSRSGLVLALVSATVGWIAPVVAWACDGNDDCKGGRICVKGECVDAKCKSDKQCPGDSICKAGACVPPGYAQVAAAQAARKAGPEVTLQSKSGPVKLSPVDGNVKTIVAPFVGMRRWVVFDSLAANTRTSDHSASVLVTADHDPHNTFWLVKLEQNTDAKDRDRSLQVDRPALWGGVLANAPDGDFIVKYSAKEDSPGLWRITPDGNLKKGEYGIYVAKNQVTSTLYDFGVDQ